jgi:adenosylcobinamide-GDP ribazoletransferase
MLFDTGEDQMKGGRVVRFFYRVLLAFSMLTRIPLRLSAEPQHEDCGFAVYFFPLAAAAVGAVTALAYVLCWFAGLTLLAYAVAVLVPVLITGALHLDGLADTCDGIFSGKDRERMLLIMRDSRLGTMGAAALFFDLLLRVALLFELSAILTTYSMAVIVGVLPVMGKLSLVAGGALHPYARSEGTGKHWIDKMNATHMLMCALIGGALLQVFFNEGWIFLAVVPLAAGAFAAWRFSRRLGGLTGDTLGALNELGELLFLAGVLVWARL